MAEQAEAGRAPGTQAQRLTAVKSLFRWLKAEGIINEDPSRTIRPPRSRPVPAKPLTQRDVATILKACGSQCDRAMISLLSSTGLRVGELAGITTDRLDLDQRKVLILGKGSRWRVVPISDAAARELARYLRERRKSRFADDPRLWLGERGPVAREGVAQVIRRMTRRAGVEGRVNPHRYRHSFANRWLENGGSEQALMKIAGWSSLSMLDRYSAHGAEDRALAEYRRLWRT